MDELTSFYLGVANVCWKKMALYGSFNTDVIAFSFVFNYQVSHHPPISACHCESKNFVFWQGLYFNYNFKIQLVSLQNNF